MTRRSTSFWLLAVGIATTLSGPATADVRFLAVGSKPSDGDNALDRMLAKSGSRFDPVLPAKLDEASLGTVDVVLIDVRSIEELSRAGERAVALLEGAVDRGAGLVVAGEVAALFPASERFSRLLGRRHPVDESASKKSAALTLEIPDQSHAITQCVTALHLAAMSIPCEARDGMVELARVAGRETRGPCVFWTRRGDRGRVAVLAVAPAVKTVAQDAAKDERDARRAAAALALLTARAVEWAADQTVTVKIPEEMPLAVERLASAEAGIIEGAAPAEGFFKGRQIAPVMGYQGADWLERRDREKTEQPERVLDALEIAQASTVADVGAGTGYFSFRMARRVGPLGKVLAVDLQEEMLELLKERIAKDGVKNVEPVLASEGDPHLPAASVDLALLVDVYHELSKPAEVLSAIRKSLKPGSGDSRPGRLVLVEYRGDDPRIAIKPLHRTTVQQVRAEIEPVGFRLVQVHGFLPQQNILVFERKERLER